MKLGPRAEEGGIEFVDFRYRNFRFPFGGETC
jgi:hypothetical protein